MKTLRPLVLLAPLVLAGAGLDATPAHGSPDEAITVLVPAMSVVPVAETKAQSKVATVVPEEEAPLEPVLAATTATPDAFSRPLPTLADSSYDEVRWTVDFPEPLEVVASRWGLKAKALIELNPELDLRRSTKIDPGTALRVYLADEERPTRSIGSPNKGKLQHGLPMPEGPYWTLRDRRTRAYGATNAVQAMMAAFTRYGEAFPGAPRVNVGELSARRGGRAAPHKSHRTGRDVDLGYILNDGIERERWARANEKNFDAEKNWVLIKALVDTGQVQSIFISSRLQRLLRPVARRELDDAEFGRYFRVTGSDPMQAPIISHEDGHRDHMHVRFRCEAGNPRCRSRSQSGR